MQHRALPVLEYYLYFRASRGVRPKAPEPHPQQHTLIVEGSVLYLIYVLIIFKEYRALIGCPMANIEVTVSVGRPS